MIEVSVVYHLSHGYVVNYARTLYILNDWDIIFIDNKAYTYPNKLTQRYR